MKAAVFYILVKLFFRKEGSEMLVRLYAGEIILGKITIEEVPNGLRPRVAAYLIDIGYTENEANA